jgi:four helix bundle protein
MAGANRYEDLVAWQLSVQLRDGVYRLVMSGAAARNFKFRDQILDASSSPSRNIAEGFGRYRPRAFAQFVRIARASLLETRNLLQEGQSKSYFNEPDVEPLLRLQERALKATTKFLRYLESCNGEAPTDWAYPPDTPEP